MNSGSKIPGYTGFVPFKSEFFGTTSSQSNKQAEEVYKVSSASGKDFAKVGRTILEIQNGNVVSRSHTVDGGIEQEERRMMIGNKSKNATSWLQGPTHEIRNQCLPGYTGFIPGVKAENAFAVTYANNTANSFTNSIPRGAVCSPDERFKTMTGTKFSPQRNRRIAERSEFQPRRDYIEYAIAVNN